MNMTDGQKDQKLRDWTKEKLRLHALALDPYPHKNFVERRQRGCPEELVDSLLERGA